MENAISDSSDGGLTKPIVGFCRFVRANGLNVGLQETLDALIASRVVPLADRETFKFALRSLLCSSKEEYELFDQLFDRYWLRSLRAAAIQKRDGQARVEVRTMEAAGQRSSDEAAPSDEESDRKATAGASAQERLKKTDFSKVSDSDLELLEQISLRLWKQMGERLTRRLRFHDDKGLVNLRRTIRHNLSRGGEPIELRYKRRKRQKTNLVALLDVSGSMDQYSMFLLRFVYALQKHFRRVDSFIFSTRLTNVTKVLRGDRLAGVLRVLSESVEGWSGGTRIGACLEEFNRRYARSILSRKSLVMIMSDGWDTGEPEALQTELGAIKRRARKLIWLNPLLSMADYQPVTRGMAAALPLADVFAPAHNLESLLNLERHLSWSR